MPKQQEEHIKAMIRRVKNRVETDKDSETQKYEANLYKFGILIPEIKAYSIVLSDSLKLKVNYILEKAKEREYMLEKLKLATESVENFLRKSSVVQHSINNPTNISIEFQGGELDSDSPSEENLDTALEKTQQAQIKPYELMSSIIQELPKYNVNIEQTREAPLSSKSQYDEFQKVIQVLKKASASLPILNYDIVDCLQPAFDQFKNLLRRLNTVLEKSKRLGFYQRGFLDISLDVIQKFLKNLKDSFSTIETASTVEANSEELKKICKNLEIVEKAVRDSIPLLFTFLEESSDDVADNKEEEEEAMKDSSAVLQSSTSRASERQKVKKKVQTKVMQEKSHKVR